MVVVACVESRASFHLEKSNVSQDVVYLNFWTGSTVREFELDENLGNHVRISRWKYSKRGGAHTLMATIWPKLHAVLSTRF